jgi:hypothetical protein
MYLLNLSESSSPVKWTAAIRNGDCPKLKHRYEI